MGLNKSFISDITMFFIGAIIGTILHDFFQWFIATYQIESIISILFVGLIQLLCIAFFTKTLPAVLSVQGFFIFGIITSQDILIFKIYPKNRK